MKDKEVEKIIEIIFLKKELVKTCLSFDELK